MNKETIELDKYTRRQHGGAGGFYPPTDYFPKALNKLVEWTKGKPGLKIYDYIVRTEEKETGLMADDDYLKKPRCIPICDFTVYLDIYWQ